MGGVFHGPLPIYAGRVTDRRVEGVFGTFFTSTTCPYYRALYMVTHLHVHVCERQSSSYASGN